MVVRLIVVLILLTLFAFSQASPSFAQKSIAVSGYPLLSVLSELFPEASLFSILPPKGDFHHHELKPRDIQNIKDANLVVIVGTEPWSKRALNLRAGKVLSLTQPGEKLPDPHVWFSLERVAKLVAQISANADQERANRLLKDIEGLKVERAKLTNCKKKQLFHLGHRVFYYLLEGTGIEEIPLVAPHHFHGEVSPRALKGFLERLEKNQSKRIVLSSSEFAKYENFFKSRGYEVLRAYSGDEPIGFGYAEFIRTNLSAIKKALNCEE